MRFTSSAEVTIPAHKLAQFKASLKRHAPSEHSGIRLGQITAYELRREGAYAVVRVLIDSDAEVDLGEFSEQWETEESNSAAINSIAYAIVRVGGDHDYSVDTQRAVEERSDDYR